MIGSSIATVLEGARLNALLIAAIEHKLSAYLSESPSTVPVLAERAGISLRGCQAVADGMVGLRLWRVQDGVYSNTPSAEAALVPGSPDYVGDQQPDLFRAWLPSFARLPELVRTGEPAHPIDSEETLYLWSLLTPVLANKGRHVPEEAIEILELSQGDPHLVDIGGGGGGLYSRALLSANPRSRATQIDWPHINAAARARLESEGLADRFATIDGSFYDVMFPTEAFDVAVLSHIVHQESPESNGVLLCKVASALRPGGRLIISDWVVDDGRTGSASSLLFNITMLILSAGGKSYEREELTRLLTQSGFNPPTFTVSKDRATLVIASKA